MSQINDFVHHAFTIGGICVWEWQTITNTFTFLGQFSHLGQSASFGLSEQMFYDQIHSEDRAKVNYMLENTRAKGAKFDIEFRLSSTDEPQWIMGIGERVSENETVKVIGVFVNISHYKEKAALLSKRQAQFANLMRLSSMGEMASLLAHEMSQPLVVINTYIAGCVRRLEEDQWEKDKIIAAMKKANEHVELAGGLIHRLKNYIRKEGLHVEKINIHETIESAVSLVAYDNSQYPLVIQYDFGKLPSINCDELQIKFVIVSLINNAIDAMIAANNKCPRITIQTTVSDEQEAIVSVHDCGTGILTNLQEKLFNAYCSTKQQGTGLTLIICRGIIEGHNGFITAENISAGGAKFTFKIPLLNSE